MPYYLCNNFGKCDIADSGELIELPAGAEPICPAPACREPLSPGGNSISDPTSVTVPAVPEKGKHRLLYAAALVGVLIAGLIGGVAYLLFTSLGPESLTLEAPPQVIAWMGESLQVPVTVNPRVAEDVRLTVQGKLPPGVLWDASERRLDGMAQRPGSFPIVFHADSPRFGAASAATMLVVQEKRGVPANLTLWVEPYVLGRVGEPLEVPVGIGPAGMEGATVSVTGELPAGVTWDPSGKRLYGTPESAGSTDAVLTVSAPGYAAASAGVNLTILEANPLSARAEVTSSPPGFQPAPTLRSALRASPTPAPDAVGEFTSNPASGGEFAPNLVKLSPAPPGSSETVPEDLLTEPRLRNETSPVLRNALRNCDRVALSFQFDRREFDSLDRTSVENLSRLVAFLRKPGLSNRRLVIVGCTDGTGTRSENDYFARARAEAFAGFLQAAGVKNPIDQLLGSNGDYLVQKRDPSSPSRDPQSNRRVDVYLRK